MVVLAEDALRLDPGIRRAVEGVQRAGIETFESCDGVQAGVERAGAESASTRLSRP